MHIPMHSVLLLLVSLLPLVACSPTVPIDFDIDQASADVRALTTSFLASMSDGTAPKAYANLVDARTRAKLSEADFLALSGKIASALGPLESLEPGNRFDVDPHEGGLLARTSFAGHFAKGTATVTMGALYLDRQWRVLTFNVHLPPELANGVDSGQPIELYVSGSDLVMPGGHARIVATGQVERVLVEDVVVQAVRWKGFPEHPQEGFVTVGLRAADMDKVKDVEGLALRAVPVP